jgi:hypothetical protein
MQYLVLGRDNSNVDTIPFLGKDNSNVDTIPCFRKGQFKRRYNTMP